VVEVLAPQLDGSRSRTERKRRLLKAAAKVAYWQRAAAKAARCHRTRRLRRLRALGIRVSRLQKCFRCK
jgi:hypothetical protein